MSNEITRTLLSCEDVLLTDQVALVTGGAGGNAIRAAVERTVKELGRLDILVNNAGGARPIKLLDITDAQADKQIALNLESLVTATQAAAKAMNAAGRGGSIINIASIEAMRAAPGYCVYA